MPDLINSDFKKSAASSLPNLPINSTLPPRELMAKLATGAGPPRRFSSPFANILIGFSGKRSILTTLSRKIGPTQVIMGSIVMKIGGWCC
jgi:hypothetical protein